VGRKPHSRRTTSRKVACIRVKAPWGVIELPEVPHLCVPIKFFFAHVPPRIERIFALPGETFGYQEDIVGSCKRSRYEIRFANMFMSERQ
jgi:hypothetical protein